jgi:Chaperone of endosialidase
MNFSTGKQMGVIAQEVEKVFPELVTTNGDGYKRVNYIGLIPVLIESIKEQQTQIEKQNQKIEKLTQLVKKSFNK